MKTTGAWCGVTPKRSIMGLKNGKMKPHHFTPFLMENKKQPSTRKVSAADFDAVCSCGSGEIAGACCKSGEMCPCGSGLRAGECCYAPVNGEDEE
jgi:hypothetical protein